MSETTRWPQPLPPSTTRGLMNRGAWAVGSAYDTNDVVEYQGNAWVALSTHVGQTPYPSSLYWSKLVDKGDAITPLGAWSPTVEYTVNDVVTNDGSSYICIVDNLNSEPPSANWLLLAAAGPTVGNPDFGPGPNRNFLVNGGFDIWQRNTTFSASGLTADMWRLTISSGTATVSRQASFSGFRRWCLRLTTASSPVVSLSQRIEWGAALLAGKNIIVSFRAKSTAGGTVALTVRKNYGTGGSPSGEEASASTNIAIAAGGAGGVYSAAFSISTNVGKTFGTNLNDYVSIELSSASAITVDIEDFQCEINRGDDVPSDFSVEDVNTTFSKCQRQYQIHTVGLMQGGALGFYANWVPFAVPMRGTPVTAITTAPAYTNATGASVVSPNNYGFGVQFETTSAGGYFTGLTATFDASL